MSGMRRRLNARTASAADTERPHSDGLSAASAFYSLPCATVYRPDTKVTP
ncbi:hypothetical protein HMPREF9120_00944, partial [Neisseria sp. oral taxon 020 str. F0370]